MTHFDNAAHNAGYEAACAGLALTDCPFSDITSAGKAWKLGYFLGKIEPESFFETEEVSE